MLPMVTLGTKKELYPIHSQLICKLAKLTTCTPAVLPVLIVYGLYIHFNRLDAEFTRTPEHRNAILIFKRNHVAAASQQKQVLVRLTGILQAFLTYEKKVKLLMELMS